MAEVSPILATPTRTASQVEWQWLTAPTGSAPPATTPMRVYAPVFHPAAASQGDAVPITVSAGEERGGVDIRLSLNPTANLDVNVIPQTTDPIQENVLAMAEERTRNVAGRRVDPSGHAVIPSLPPGRYTVVAKSAQNAASALFGMANLDLAGTDQVLSIQLQPGADVQGKVTVTQGAGAPPKSLAGIRISLSPGTVGVVSALGAPVAMTDASGAFAFRNVIPDRYRVRIIENGGNLGGGWVARSATIGSTEALDSPVEVRAGGTTQVTVELTPRLGELTGTFLDESGRAAPDYFVVAFSPDESAWVPGSRRVMAVRPGLDGHFQFVNLPAGEYLVGAATDVDQYQWFDRDFLRELSGVATRVVIADGVTTTKDLKISRR